MVGYVRDCREAGEGVVSPELRRTTAVSAEPRIGGEADLKCKIVKLSPDMGVPQLPME